ncbi:efflux RND transporter periplasmic adaptor subunit [Rhizobiaceae bacterium n13]|uniref:Efflux RND transporter periplasmic adaptor subunit n=1 Tax=Ferirhizobium litorale TaxID=2927786 RepID=A0AAE3QI19_9HYPH|nr:efflux RND transporter periplasmic adaptor subunit [Fererhizobium litorale]MDI7862617.1 efflux RND transporter periplasmic adaptor subunit [Fererhizobium litorale]MDI7923900.1 efflux RND transporter periplasmic adaptor subunit [Fererhizobium litorale]
MTLSRLRATLPLLLSISLLAGCDEGSVAGEEASPRPVKTVTATAEPLKTGSLPGVVQARIETDLAFRTLGRIVSRKVEVGDLVSRGEVVAEIDPLSLQLAVRSAEADLRDAQAEFDNAALTEKRKRTLTNVNAASIADYDLAEQQLKSAKANVAKATASLAKAQEQLGYAELRAEFDGVVTATFAEMGQTVSAGQPVLKLARLEQRDVVVDVPEALLSLVRLDESFEASLQLDRKLRTLGTVREIAPQADPNTRTYRVKLAIDRAPEVFRLGAVVTVNPIAEAKQGSIPLPIAAIGDMGGAEHVWVVDQLTGTVTSRPVQLDTPAPGARSVRIRSGLREGEQVVVAGVNELADGQKVKLEQEPRQ